MSDDLTSLTGQERSDAAITGHRAILDGEDDLLGNKVWKETIGVSVQPGRVVKGDQAGHP